MVFFRVFASRHHPCSRRASLPLRNLSVPALDSSSLRVTLNLQLSTFNRVSFLSPSSPHLCALCVLCGENSLSFRSSLIPRRSPLTSQSFTIRPSEPPLPQLLYNPHLQVPLGSAGNKGLITPLESALTKNSPVSPLESALPKRWGVGVRGIPVRILDSGEVSWTSATGDAAMLSLAGIFQDVLESSNREPRHGRRTLRPLQRASHRACRAADVAHTDDPRGIPNLRRSRHVADFFAVHGQNRSRLRHRVAGKGQFNALPVHLSARAHPLHDFLSRVAALGIADVAVLQSRLVRNLLFSEVVAKPRRAQRQPLRTQRRVAHRPAPLSSRGFQQNPPKFRELLPVHNELAAGNSSRRAFHDAAGNRSDCAIMRGKFAKRPDVNAGHFTDHCGGLRPFQRQRAVPLRFVRQRHVVHDDVFIQPRDQPLANHGVRHAKEFVRKGVRFDFRKNVPLRIQQQRNVALSRGKILDVVRQNRVQVAHSVGPGESEIGAVVLVDQRDALARMAILSRRVTKIIGQGASEPHAHPGARTQVRRGQWSVQRCAGRSHFHASSIFPASSLSNCAAGHAAPPANPFISDAILQCMSDALPTLNAATEGLIHITVPVGLLQCNCSIIGDPVTREALVVDPGDEVTRILDLIGRHKLNVKAIVSTHAHIDHVGGLSKLHQYTGAPVLMHRDDLPLYQAMEMQAAFLGVLTPELTDVDQLLKEGDVLHWGPFEAQVIHTPGHTPGSVSLYLPHDAGKIAVPAPQLFSGDTLFAGSIGRTDLWGGSMDQIMDSLRTKLMGLPDETIVYPGHGPATTIGDERHLNPFLQVSP